MTSSLLKVEGFFKTFGGLAAVRDLSFEVAEGEIVGLIGPNGAGKSTAVNMISCTLVPSAGKIVFAGEDITGRKPSHVVKHGLAAAQVALLHRGDLLLHMHSLAHTIRGLLLRTWRDDEGLKDLAPPALIAKVAGWPAVLAVANLMRALLQAISGRTRAVATQPYLKANPTDLGVHRSRAVSD